MEAMALIEIDGVYRSFCSMVDLSSSLAFVRFPDDRNMNPPIFEKNRNRRIPFFKSLPDNIYHHGIKILITNHNKTRFTRIGSNHQITSIMLISWKNRKFKFQ